MRDLAHAHRIPPPAEPLTLLQAVAFLLAAFLVVVAVLFLLDGLMVMGS